MSRRTSLPAVPFSLDRYCNGSQGRVLYLWFAFLFMETAEKVSLAENFSSEPRDPGLARILDEHGAVSPCYL